MSSPSARGGSGGGAQHVAHVLQPLRHAVYLRIQPQLQGGYAGECVWSQGRVREYKRGCVITRECEYRGDVTREGGYSRRAHLQLLAHDSEVLHRDVRAPLLRPLAHLKKRRLQGRTAGCKGG